MRDVKQKPRNNAPKVMDKARDVGAGMKKAYNRAKTKVDIDADQYDSPSEYAEAELSDMAHDGAETARKAVRKTGNKVKRKVRKQIEKRIDKHEKKLEQKLEEKLKKENGRAKSLRPTETVNTVTTNSKGRIVPIRNKRAGAGNAKGILRDKRARS